MRLDMLPNLATCLRFALTAALLFPDAAGAAFTAIYLAAGLTDALDGFLARRLRAASAFGARLDSTADLFLAAVLLFRLWPVVSPSFALLLWVAGIALLRLFAAITAKVRFGGLGFLHTIGNKLAGFVLFCYPLSLYFTRSEIVPYAVCAVATLSAAEELLIELTAERFEPDRAGFFINKK